MKNPRVSINFLQINNNLSGQAVQTGHYSYSYIPRVSGVCDAGEWLWVPSSRLTLSLHVHCPCHEGLVQCGVAPPVAEYHNTAHLPHSTPPHQPNVANKKLTASQLGMTQMQACTHRLAEVEHTRPLDVVHSSPTVGRAKAWKQAHQTESLQNQTVNCKTWQSKLHHKN